MNLSTQDDQFIVSFGLFNGFVESKKNIESHQLYPLSKYPVGCLSVSVGGWLFPSANLAFLCASVQSWFLVFLCSCGLWTHDFLRLFVCHITVTAVFWQQVRHWLSGPSCTSIIKQISFKDNSALLLMTSLCNSDCGASVEKTTDMK